MRKKLNARTIETLKPPAKGRIEVTDTESGAVFRITAKGARSWSVLYTVGGVQSRLTLGAYPAVSLGDARAGAREARHLASQGIDPQAEKRRQQASQRTLAAAVREYLSAHSAGRLEGQRKVPSPQSVATEGFDARWVIETLGDRPVAEIGKGDVTRLADAIAHLAPSGRRRVWGVANRVLNREVARDALDANPMAGRKPPAASAPRQRFLTADEIAAVWRASEDLGAYGALVRLLIALPLRRSLAANLTWDRVDLDARTVRFDATETGNKMREAATLPLNDHAVAAVTWQGTGTAGLVFPGRLDGPLGGWSKLKARLDRQSRVSNWVLHDLRRSVMRGLGDNLEDLDADAAERLLMHKRTGLDAVYQTSARLTGMRRLAGQWDRILGGWLGEGEAVVVEMVR